jgi:hypothetical protein
MKRNWASQSRPKRRNFPGKSSLWQVDDIEREVADLKARGVRFERYELSGQTSHSEIVVGGGAKAAWFKDSEGNIMAVIQSLD